jgi:hypothetical protein
MVDCRWLRLEWTGENHLRHSKFTALREDKKGERRPAGK